MFRIISMFFLFPVDPPVVGADSDGGGDGGIIFLVWPGHSSHPGRKKIPLCGETPHSKIMNAGSSKVALG